MKTYKKILNWVKSTYTKVFGGYYVHASYPKHGYEIRVKDNVAKVHITNDELYNEYVKQLANKLIRGY